MGRPHPTLPVAQEAWESALEFPLLQRDREGRDKTHDEATSVTAQANDQIKTSDGSTYADGGLRMGKDQPFLTL